MSPEDKLLKLCQTNNPLLRELINTIDDLLINIGKERALMSQIISCLPKCETCQKEPQAYIVPGRRKECHSCFNDNHLGDVEIFKLPHADLLKRWKDLKNEADY